MNKKIGIFALVMLALGAVSSVAIQSFAEKTLPAQAQPSSNVSTQTDQNIDQKDAQGNDLETNDDSTSTSVSGNKKEGVNDSDSDVKSEQSENDSGQTDSGE